MYREKSSKSVEHCTRLKNALTKGFLAGGANEEERKNVMDTEHKTDCNIVEQAVYIKAIATAGLTRRLIDYAAFVAVSLGADVDAGNKAVDDRGTTTIDAVKAAADDVLGAFGRIATADYEVAHEADREYRETVDTFADILAAYVCEESTAHEFDLVRWEVADPQPVILA